MILPDRSVVKIILHKCDVPLCKRNMQYSSTAPPSDRLYVSVGGPNCWTKLSCCLQM